MFFAGVTDTISFIQVCLTSATIRLVLGLLANNFTARLGVAFKL